MEKRKISLILSFIILILIMFTLQTSAAAAIRVMAAASLQEPLNEIKERFEAENTNFELEINYAGSQALFSQIKLGVKFDLFLSANFHYLAQLKKENMITKDKIFAKNELIIIINSSSKKVANLEQLLGSDYSLLIGAEAVPVGDYTLKMFNQYLKSISNKEKRQKLKNSFDSAVVSREFDVKSVLNKVKLGAAEAGIVYLSDYSQDENLYKVEIPAEYNIEASYYMGLSQQSQAGAVKFYNYILSTAAQKVFGEYNFKQVQNK
ncbi:molybdate transport system substrate-binding protein [Halanaerobium saccharolyticum]|uniref:Molybdate transport system substrate-binding protein n=1 Tax=Halanaerobium saccharolyticum TaxID=43595 RepID=A0A4R6LXK9_9FIRM|nr:molybdate ABC transporter substrate-binding protein [Halanaerobium saccharolyticum]TDO92139.1 molybdate transport system substrate-binding protein [Halanaerobium saccharolyticum]